MGKTFDPTKYNMILCPLCKGKGTLDKNPDGFDVCKECEGFGFFKNEPQIFVEVEDSQIEQRKTVYTKCEEEIELMFKTMLVEDNSSFRQLVKNNLQIH